MKTVEPFLKWAGGKRWLVKSGRMCLPDRYNTYFEPFVGGGAVFFHMRTARGVISDTNAELINFYQVIRDHPKCMRTALADHQKRHGKDHYYAVRSSQPTCAIERAIRFLYLNRACWNGLYRVNREGHFNVPIGTKQNIVYETDDFEGASAALKKAEILCSDFEPMIDRASEGDFIFVDPPYTVKHNFNGFLRYNEQIFSWEDQERLRTALGRAAERGCYITVTNADHESVRELYAAGVRYQQVTRTSLIAGQSQKRGAVTEALFMFNMS